MAVRLTIKEAAKKRGIKSAYELSTAMQIDRASAGRLFNNKPKMLALTTIEALCLALDCSPADIIEVKKDRKK